MRPRLRRSDEEQPSEEAPAESEASAEPVHEERQHEWQPRLWLKLLVLLAVIAYAVAFVLENRKRVELHFVVGTAHVSLIWLVLLSIGLGVLGGVLLSQLNRRRSRRK